MPIERQLLIKLALVITLPFNTEMKAQYGRISMKKIYVVLAVILLAMPIDAQEYSLKKAVFSSCAGNIEGEHLIACFTIGQTLFQEQLNGDLNVLWGFWTTERIVTDADKSNTTPQFVFELKQNYPNPFNPITTIPYSIGGSDRVFVNLKIYDVNGSLIRTLVSEYKSPGIYRAFWDGHNDYGRLVSSGLYFCRIQGNDFIKTNKLVLLR